MTSWSRRQVLMAGGVLPALGWARGSSNGLTASRIIDRIREHVGVPWRTETVDTVIAGAPDTPVRGIATTMMATLDVVQRAHAAGKNMVITHEPTFFSHQDAVKPFQDDPTFKFKRDFLERHGMVVFRFHDHWHARRPDGIATGMMRELGWERHADPADPRRFRFDGVPLSRLARDIQTRLGIRVLRVIGDPGLRVRNAVASWGYVMLEHGAALVARDDVDVLFAGETREWELVEYVQDAVAAGRPKALVIVGHVLSEQAGMKYCAEWLRRFISEVPVDFVPAAEPWWTPERPPAGA